MLKNVLNTLASKFFQYVFSFLLLILSTQYLGVYGRGVVSIIIASAGILNLLSGLIGGSSIVYLIPQNKTKDFLRQILIISFLWIIFTSIAGLSFLFLINFIPKELFLHTLILSILISLFSLGSMILLSQEKIVLYNLSNLMQVFFSFFLFGLFITLSKSAPVDYYLISLHISYAISFVFICYFLMRAWKKMENSDKLVKFPSTLKKLIKYGFIAQTGNIIQYLNYRLSYFILASLGGLSSVGIYSVGVVLSEAVWSIASSIALVQYSKIANTSDAEYSKNLTIKLSKFSFLITFLVLVILLAIPADVISFVFGKDFVQIKVVIYSLSIGILSLGFSMILSHYFAGLGKYYINTLATIIGLIITLLGNYLLIPKFGYIGSGMTASISYLAMSVFLFFSFLKTTNTKIALFKLTKMDIVTLLRIVKVQFKI